MLLTPELTSELRSTAISSYSKSRIDSLSYIRLHSRRRVRLSASIRLEYTRVGTG